MRLACVWILNILSWLWWNQLTFQFRVGQV
uniref:Uncharacterized protein n=1 Tax=Anguilla anguilla TaxID=7936 RepID=A0A0E9QJB2_ANGAN